MAFPNDPIQHVVLLMLENRSFDHLLGDLVRLDPVRGIAGIDRQNPGSNPRAGRKTVKQSDNALSIFPKGFDPKHELPNVQKQLGDFTNPTMTGFVADVDNVLKKFDEATRDQVMAYFPAMEDIENDPLPALRSLARNFTVCDHWYSSLPGPTWPNRFFSLCGTAAGYAKMPESISDIGLLFRAYDMETIFDRLRAAGRSHRIFHHGVSLAMLLRRTWRTPGIYSSMDDFFSLAQSSNADDFPAFSLIEPQYFSLIGSSQNDQHPPHDMALGDKLIADVYNALRGNLELWQRTLLVVAYDEHGGFYDHLAPPQTVPPDSCKDKNFGFDFTRLGVRVPAILVSPHVHRAGVDHGIYDHTSLLAYLCRKWDMPPLGERCATTADFSGAIVKDANPHAPEYIAAKTPKTVRALAAEAPLENENQVALSLMVDFVHGELGLTSRPTDESIATRALVAPPTGGQVVRKAQQALAMLSEIPPDEKVFSPFKVDLNEAAISDQRPLRVLMVHGVGHGDDPASDGWKQQWEQAFKGSAVAAGLRADTAIEFVFARFDDIFERFPLDPVIIMRGLLRLGEGLFSVVPEMGTRDLRVEGLTETVRWTAGMTIQWVESENLRSELSARILQTVAASRCDIICAHSLGSLACYDAFRREVVANRASGLNDKYLITFGSQIAHPAVRKALGGRIESLHDLQGHGVAFWYHLYNPHDHVFTCRLPSVDIETRSLLAEFDLPGDLLNHDGRAYLSHSVMAQTVLPALIPRHMQVKALAQSGPAFIARARARRRALLVGINEYPSASMRLNGCVNDVYLMSAVLQECGFEADDIRVLTDSRATRQAMLERLDWLSDGVGAGDERVFFYSGHGAQMPQYGSNGAPDTLCETLVPVDFDWSPEHAFTDRDFYAYYSQLPYESDFLAIFDCCHAAGLTKGTGRVRGIDPPDDVRHRALRWEPKHQMWVPRDFVEAVRGKPRLFDAQFAKRASSVAGQMYDHYVGLGESRAIRLKSSTAYDKAREEYGHWGPYLPLLMFAAGQNELAAEYDHGSTAYGAFTFAVAKYLRQQRRAPTFSRLIESVRQELVQLGYHQTPTISGPTEKMKQAIPIFRWKQGARKS